MNDIRLLRFLLDQGGIGEREANLLDPTEKAPLHYAAEFKYLELGKLLLTVPGINVNIANKQGKTPLHFIAEDNDNNQMNSIAFAKLLLSFGADINFRAKDGQTPLHEASNSFHWEMVEFLVLQGADVNTQDDDGATALTCPVLDHNFGISKMLIDSGAEVNFMFYHETHLTFYLRYQTSLLHEAVSDVDLLCLLINSGAAINSRDEYGRTPLHVSFDCEASRILLKSGAIWSFVDNRGRSPLDFAINVHRSKRLVTYYLMLEVILMLCSIRHSPRFLNGTPFAIIPLELVQKIIFAVNFENFAHKIDGFESLL